MERAQVRWWVAGDWDAFFGLGTNSVLNILVLSGLLLFLIEMPKGIVFGRIIPAVGLSLIVGLPAISLPCGRTTAGLPVGLQLVGAPFADGLILALASAFEAVHGPLGA